jgi:hypothetical protein
VINEQTSTIACAAGHLPTCAPEIRFRERLHCSRHSLSQRFNSTPFHSITPVERSNQVRVKSFQFSSTRSAVQQRPSLVTFAFPHACCPPLPSRCFPSEIPRKRGSSQESASFFLSSEVGLFLFFSFFKKNTVVVCLDFGVTRA